MEFIHNVKVLVTGGAGFIGSNLTDALLALGNEVTVFPPAKGKTWPIWPEIPPSR